MGVMQVATTPLPDVLVFTPSPHRDDRGLFTRTFDAAVAREHGLETGHFQQDSQSRTTGGVLRGLHGRSGRGEAKLVRCARGAILDVIIDIRPSSPAFGRSWSIRLDDERFAQLYVPAGFLHGFQVLSDVADVCYRIDRPHDPSEDVGVRYDDPDLGIDWPAAPVGLSERDRRAGSFADLRRLLLAHPEGGVDRAAGTQLA